MTTIHFVAEAALKCCDRENATKNTRTLRDFLEG
jgi:hypothetical protein